MGGAALAIESTREEHRPTFLTAMFVSFGVFHVAQGSLYQKYFDVIALITALAMFSRSPIRPRWAYPVVVMLYVVGFAFYAFWNPWA